MNEYDKVVSRIQPTNLELAIIANVRKGQESDTYRSPFETKRWSKSFEELNKVGLSLRKAPINRLLMVVTERLGTLYATNRGASIMRGSVLVKLSDNLVYCLDAYSWGALQTGDTVTYKNNGYFEFNNDSLYGGVKLVENIRL